MNPLTGLSQILNGELERTTGIYLTWVSSSTLSWVYLVTVYTSEIQNIFISHNSFQKREIMVEHI